jgi:hypothetical protein
MVCDYVVPTQRGLCQQQAWVSTVSADPWTIGNSLVRGGRAIVVVVTNAFCVKTILGTVRTNYCLRNGDPNAGLPADTSHFWGAFDATFWPVPANSLVRLKGKWYIALA